MKTEVVNTERPQDTFVDVTESRNSAFGGFTCILYGLSMAAIGLSILGGLIALAHAVGLF